MRDGTTTSVSRATPTRQLSSKLGCSACPALAIGGSAPPARPRCSHPSECRDVLSATRLCMVDSHLRCFRLDPRRDSDHQPSRVGFAGRFVAWAERGPRGDEQAIVLYDWMARRKVYRYTPPVSVDRSTFDLQADRKLAVTHADFATDTASWAGSLPQTGVFVACRPGALSAGLWRSGATASCTASEPARGDRPCRPAARRSARPRSVRLRLRRPLHGVPPPADDIRRLLPRVDVLVTPITGEPATASPG